MAENYDTQLSGIRLRVARAMWLALLLFNLAMLAVAVPAELAWQANVARNLYAGPLAELGLTPSFYAAFCTALDVGLVLAFMLIGIIMFWRRSDDWMVLLVAMTGIMFAALFIPTLVFLMRSAPQWRLPVALVRAAGLISSLIGIYYLFPDGRFVPRLTRWLALAWLTMVLTWLLWPAAPINPIYMDTWLQDQGLAFGVFVIVYGTGVAAQAYRYRLHSSLLERQQTRWVVFGITAGFVSYCIYQGPPLVVHVLAEPGRPYLLYIFWWRPVYYLLIALVPLCIGISILRYRLWDIDLLIRRTLVYAILTGLLVLFYAGSVLLLQQAFRLILRQASVPAIVTSTLGLAALFQPLRSRVQEVIDRRFYRAKYDAERVLTTFSATVRDEVNLDEVAQHLVAAVEDTMQPAHVSMWLKEIERRP